MSDDSVVTEQARAGFLQPCHAKANPGLLQAEVGETSGERCLLWCQKASGHFLKSKCRKGDFSTFYGSIEISDNSEFW